MTDAFAVPTFTSAELEAEEWRAAVGYEGTYAVSNLGRVRREVAGMHTHAGRILTPYWQKGQARVTLTRTGSDGRKTSDIAAIHRTVAAAFLRPLVKGEIVAFRRGRDDFRPANLRILGTNGTRGVAKAERRRVAPASKPPRPDVAPAGPPTRIPLAPALAPKAKSGQSLRCRPLAPDYRPDALDLEYRVEDADGPGWAGHRWDIARTVAGEHHHCRRCDAERDVLREPLGSGQWMIGGNRTLQGLSKRESEAI